MTLTLPPELETFVHEKVKTGSFSNEREVVCAALGLMREHDQEYARQLSWLREAIEEGWREAQAGNLTSAEDFKAEFEEHKRRWRAAQTKSA